MPGKDRSAEISRFRKWCRKQGYSKTLAALEQEVMASDQFVAISPDESSNHGVVLVKAAKHSSSSCSHVSRDAGRRSAPGCLKRCHSSASPQSPPRKSCKTTSQNASKQETISGKSGAECERKLKRMRSGSNASSLIESCGREPAKIKTVLASPESRLPRTPAAVSQRNSSSHSSSESSSDSSKSSDSEASSQGDATIASRHNSSSQKAAPVIVSSSSETSDSESSESTDSSKDNEESDASSSLRRPRPQEPSQIVVSSGLKSSKLERSDSTDDSSDSDESDTNISATHAALPGDSVALSETHNHLPKKHLSRHESTTANLKCRPQTKQSKGSTKSKSKANNPDLKTKRDGQADSSDPCDARHSASCSSLESTSDSSSDTDSHPSGDSGSESTVCSARVSSDNSRSNSSQFGSDPTGDSRSRSSTDPHSDRPENSNRMKVPSTEGVGASGSDSESSCSSNNGSSSGSNLRPSSSSQSASQTPNQRPGSSVDQSSGSDSCESSSDKFKKTNKSRVDPGPKLQTGPKAHSAPRSGGAKSKSKLVENSPQITLPVSDPIPAGVACEDGRSPSSLETRKAPISKSTRPTHEKTSKPNTPFRRVKAEEVEVDHRLRDNSYMAKGGATGTYGHKAHLDLVVTRGKAFTKEKNKKKRGSYRGGIIDTGVHSIKFD